MMVLLRFTLKIMNTTHLKKYEIINTAKRCILVIFKVKKSDEMRNKLQGIKMWCDMRKLDDIKKIILRKKKRLFKIIWLKENYFRKRKGACETAAVWNFCERMWWY